MTNGLYTFDDLVRTPDDGQRYEVIDGSLVVTPMAGGEHQPLVGLLFEQIFKASSQRIAGCSLEVTLCHLPVLASRGIARLVLDERTFEQHGVVAM